MNVSTVAIVLIVFLTTPLGAQQLPPELGQRQISGAYETEVLAAIEGIPENASEAQLVDALQKILPKVFQSTTGSIPTTVRAFRLLSNQPNILPALSKSYGSIPVENYAERVFLVSLIGESHIPNAKGFFEELIWKKLPSKSDIVEGLSARDYEEMVQAKAVNGLAIMRTAESNASVLRITMEHEARSVKIAAIEAYVWNQPDRDQAVRELYETLPIELHPFIERPRYGREIDRREFDKQVDDWTKRWEQKLPQ